MNSIYCLWTITDASDVDANVAQYQKLFAYVNIMWTDKAVFQADTHLTEVGTWDKGIQVAGEGLSL